MDLTGTTLFALVATLLVSPPTSHDVLQRVTGAALAKVDSSAHGDFYIATDLTLQDGVIEVIDYREPKPGSGAMGGPLLALTLSGECISRRAVLARFGRLSVSQVPTGHSLSEQTYFSRSERWGELGFGFTEGSPDCLKTVVFKLAR